MATRGKRICLATRPCSSDAVLSFAFYGRGIGIRLPPHYAADLIQSGRAFPFQPYGRSVMQEWVEIHVPPERVDEMVPVFIEAARFVREIDPDS